MGESFSTEKMISFHQILKKGQNIKIDIWKCPIKVELICLISQSGQEDI